MRRLKIATFGVFVTTSATLGLTGCGPSYDNTPVSAAPPMAQQAPQGYGSGGGMSGVGAGASQAGGQVYQWEQVPAGQQVPVRGAEFDQGGYQIFAQSGETIVVPFVNQNLYAMKFGRTQGQAYFINEGGTPILYLPPGGYVSNAAAQGARWYPIPNDYAYERPMYVSLAPSWGEFVGMGWYPGMAYYGGLWGYSPGIHIGWMPGFYVSIGGSRYSSFGAYHSYYSTHTNYVTNRVVYNNYNTRSRNTFGSNSRTYQSSGSYGSNRRYNGGGFGSSSGSTGSFGSGRRGSVFGGSGSFRRRIRGANLRRLVFVRIREFRRGRKRRKLAQRLVRFGEFRVFERPSQLFRGFVRRFALVWRRRRLLRRRQKQFRRLLWRWQKLFRGRQTQVVLRRYRIGDFKSYEQFHFSHRRRLGFDNPSK